MTTSDKTSRRAWIVQEHSLRVLERVVRACSADGADVLPVKGILSARMLYADIAERVISDIDVRVRPRDVARVFRIARREGWEIVHRMRSYDNLVLCVDGRFVDVEAHVGPPGVCALSIDTMMSRASREQQTFGFPTLVSDPHDHAVLLLVNAFKDHMATAMTWAIDDLGRLIRAPWFDESLLLARAREANVETLVWIVAEWMSRFMSDEVWGGLRDRMGPPRRTAFASTHMWLESTGKRGELPLRVLSRFVSDRRRLWLSAAGHLTAWQLEVWWSQLGKMPWTRAAHVSAAPSPKVSRRRP